MATKVLIVGGWSYDPEDLSPLLSALPDDAIPTVIPLTDLEPPSYLHPAPLTSRFGCRIYEKPFDLAIGWSLGSMLILEAAASGVLQSPCLLLFAGCARFLRSDSNPHGVPPEQLAVMRRNLERNPSRCIRDFRRGAAFPDRASGTTSNWQTDLLEEGLDYLAGYDITDNLSDLTSEVLLVHGEKDAIINPACSEQLAQHIPSATSIRVPNAGHDLCLHDRYPISEWIQQANPST